MTLTLADFRARHSVRSYTPRPLTERQKATLNAAITLINTHEAGMHFSLVTGDDAPFKGFARSYGFFTGVKNYIVAVADTSYAWHRVRAGFCGMMLTMKIEEMGLGSCFVSGTFSASHVDARVRVGEELLFLITLGEPTLGTDNNMVGRIAMSIIHRKHKNPGEFLVTGLPVKSLYADIPHLHEALEALACAPSARNKRPTRLLVDRQLTGNGDEGYRITAEVPKGNKAYEIDLGIALYSVGEMLGGTWDFGNPATFLPY